MNSDLTDRIVLVTGASGGIGGEVVRAFAGEGAKVVAHYGTNAAAAQQLATELGPKCVAFGADLAQEADVERLFADTEKQFGPVDVLVANAGRWSEAAPLEKMTLAQWQDTLNANLTSAFLCAREFFRGISRHQLFDPALVLVGSTAASFGEADHADYAAAKAALTYGLARTLKNEISRLAPRGRVNVVCPGWTLTARVQDLAANAAAVRRVLQTIPMQKIGRPRDVAQAIVYLASSALSGHVTGQVLTVAGGMEGRVLYSLEEVDPRGA